MIVSSTQDPVSGILVERHEIPQEPCPTTTCMEHSPDHFLYIYTSTPSKSTKFILKFTQEEIALNLCSPDRAGDLSGRPRLVHGSGADPSNCMSCLGIATHSKSEHPVTLHVESFDSLTPLRTR